MISAKDLKQVDYYNLPAEKRREIEREVKEWSKVFEKVLTQLLVKRELFGDEAVLVETANGSGWGEAKLPRGATYYEAVNALLYLINDLAIDLRLRR